MPAIPAALPARINWPTAFAIGAIHVLPFGALWTGVHWPAVFVGAALYLVRGFCITGGYHRYFAHRGYRMPYFMQLLVGVIGTTAMQNGPLWWSSHHRYHHLHSDQEDDLHSPIRGFWWAHVGWLLYPDPPTAILSLVPDLAKRRLLVLVDRYHYLPPIFLGALCLWHSPATLYIGFFLSTVLLYHTTWAVNSVTHLVGHRAFATSDTSRNSLWVALLTLGEGWHNNHHHYPTTAKAGFHWWQIDVTYYLIRALACVRLARDLRVPSPAALARSRLADGSVDLGLLQARRQRATARLLRLRRNVGDFCQHELGALDAFVQKMRAQWEAALRENPQPQVLEDLIAALQRQRRAVAAQLKRRTVGYA